MRSRVLNIGHRGASAYAPEHTLASYDLALGMGADYIEQDLQMTRDGCLVVLHDSTLDRTARAGASRTPPVTCTGPVIERSLDEVRMCDVGRWFNEAHPHRAKAEYEGLTVPTLADVFERYGPETRYYIETKNPEEAPGMEEELVRLMAEHRLLEPAAEDARVLIQSFSAPSLRKIRDLDARLPTIQLVGEENRAMLDRLDLVRGYADGIGPHQKLVDERVVAAAVMHGLWVHAYTVNDGEDMRRLLELGVDGMFTNHPDKLRDLLVETGG